jgi:hypothetical protein
LITIGSFCFVLFSVGTFSALKADLVMTRKVGFYFLQVFVPSILLVVLSWVSFWVDPNAVPARVSLGVTCVLTMTTQSSGIRQSLPPVSYVKAIDIWMLVCLLFVFAALLEFAYVNVLKRKKSKKSTNHEDINEVNDTVHFTNLYKLCVFWLPIPLLLVLVLLKTLTFWLQGNMW